jgi:hypothetical protein
MTPTARTLAKLRADGYTAEVVERWNPHARVRHDLFNIADILAVRGAETLAVQVTAGSCVSARVTKLRASAALPLLCGAGWRVEVHGWRKVKRGDKATRWACRVVDMGVQYARALEAVA